MQEYFNDSARHLEGKYTFPLDDNGAVCGFEAFINGSSRSLLAWETCDSFLFQIEEKKRKEKKRKEKPNHSPLSHRIVFAGKHIIGVVKEKEQARREYQKAIEEGHGAYLMEEIEEQPDVFTVSVGNIPPKATVVIKVCGRVSAEMTGHSLHSQFASVGAHLRSSTLLSLQ